jgi:hypothetical protein
MRVAKVLLVATAFVAGLGAVPGPVSAVPLSDLLGGGTITSGNYTFSNFKFSGRGTGANVDVSALSGGPGLQFSADAANGSPFLAQSGRRTVGIISYKVTINNGPASSAALSLASVDGAEALDGGGQARARMLVRRKAAIGRADVSTTDLSSPAEDDTDFADRNTFRVRNRFVVKAGSESASFTSLVNSFGGGSPTLGASEPLTLLVAGAGLLAAGVIGRRRR